MPVLQYFTDMVTLQPTTPGAPPNFGLLPSFNAATAALKQLVAAAGPTSTDVVNAFNREINLATRTFDDNKSEGTTKGFSDI